MCTKRRQDWTTDPDSRTHHLTTSISSSGKSGQKQHLPLSVVSSSDLRHGCQRDSLAFHSRQDGHALTRARCRCSWRHSKALGTEYHVEPLEGACHGEHPTGLTNTGSAGVPP